MEICWKSNITALVQKMNSDDWGCYFPIIIVQYARTIEATDLQLVCIVEHWGSSLEKMEGQEIVMKILKRNMIA